MNLSELAEPFPAGDIEWRVSRAGNNSNGVFCVVLAYITARAIASRLDEVCGPENWRNEPMQVHEIRPGVYAMQVGISIRIDDEWVTKYDVSEATNIEPAKGGFSSAMKRAGAQWGIGRYLYHLDETFAETAERGGKGWNWGRIPEKAGGGNYYWKVPQLPAWALPKEPEHEVSKEQLHKLKRDWRDKFAADVSAPTDLLSGFEQFVSSVVGEFPASDHTCWTSHALGECYERIDAPVNEDGVSDEIPFE